MAAKSDLIRAVRETTAFPAEQSRLAVEAFLETIREALENGERVQLTGFGSFQVRDRAPRRAKDFRTGETLRIPARKAPAFKPGRHLADKIEKEEGRPHPKGLPWTQLKLF